MKLWAEKKAQWLSTLLTLAEDQSSIPTNYFGQLLQLQPQRIRAHLLASTGTCIYYVLIQIFSLKNIIF